MATVRCSAPTTDRARHARCTRLRALAVTAVLAAPFVVGAVAQARPSPASREATVAFRITDREITESSGLVVLPVDGEELAVTVNDSGDSGRVFTIDPATGDTVGVTSFSPEPRDVEALAPAGDGHVWVADIGDNLKARDSIRVTRVPVGRGNRDAGQAESYELTHPDGPRDAEALVVHPTTGRLHVITKQVLGGTVHRAPEELDPDAPNALEKVGEAPSLVTDAAFAPSGDLVVMRSYGHAWVKTFPELDKVADFALPAQPQGEGLAIDGAGQVLLSTEGLERPVLIAPLPVGLRGELAGASFFWRTFYRHLDG